MVGEERIIREGDDIGNLNDVSRKFKEQMDAEKAAGRGPKISFTETPRAKAYKTIDPSQTQELTLADLNKRLIRLERMISAIATDIGNKSTIFVNKELPRTLTESEVYASSYSGVEHAMNSGAFRDLMQSIAEDAIEEKFRSRGI